MEATGDVAFDRMHAAQRETAQVARDALAQMRKSNALAAEVTAELTAIRAENARLREALEQIEQADHPDYPHFRSGTEAMFSDHLIGVARAALAGSR